MLFNPDVDECIYINHTGHMVWIACDGTQSEQGVVERVLRTYSATPARAVDEITAFLHEMVQAGLIGLVVQNSRECVLHGAD